MYVHRFALQATVDDLIDVIEGNRIYVPAVYAMNKIDQITIEGSFLRHLILGHVKERVAVGFILFL